MQFSFISLVLLLAFMVILQIHSADSFVLTRRNIINQPLCLTTAICPVKCKRYIIRNGCPTCECNPCVYGQPLSNVSCGDGEQKCLSAGGLCKIHSWYDKPYCCPQENDGCCPPIPVDTIPNNDPDILFPCLPLCYTDADCKQGQKCCGTCPPRCMSAVIP